MDMTQDAEAQTKISVRIWRPIRERLDKRLEEACLRRDPYLAKLLQTEIKALDREVCLANSAESQAFVAKDLEQLDDLKLVTLTLPRQLVAQLNDICARKRIVRDAFFNRLFLLLSATPGQIDALLFDGSSDWRKQAWNSFKQDPSVFFDLFDPTLSALNPFWAIRDVFEEDANEADLEKHQDPLFGEVWVERSGLTGELTPSTSIYTVTFPKAGVRSLLGLSTYLPDSRVPDHPAEKKARESLDEILSAFDKGDAS